MPHRVFVGHAETRGDTVFLFSSPRSDGIFLVSNSEAGTDAFERSRPIWRWSITASVPNEMTTLPGVTKTRVNDGFIVPVSSSE